MYSQKAPIHLYACLVLLVDEHVHVVLQGIGKRYSLNEAVQNAHASGFYQCGAEGCWQMQNKPEHDMLVHRYVFQTSTKLSKHGYSICGAAGEDDVPGAKDDPWLCWGCCQKTNKPFMHSICRVSICRVNFVAMLSIWLSCMSSTLALLCLGSQCKGFEFLNSCSRNSLGRMCS